MTKQEDIHILNRKVRVDVSTTLSGKYPGSCIVLNLYKFPLLQMENIAFDILSDITYLTVGSNKSEVTIKLQ